METARGYSVRLSIVKALQALARPHCIPVVSLFKLRNINRQLKPGMLVHGPNVRTNLEHAEVIQRTGFQERRCRVIGRSPVNNILAGLAGEFRPTFAYLPGDNFTLHEHDIALQDDNGNPECGTGSLLAVAAVTCVNEKRRVPKFVSDLSTTASAGEPAVPGHLFLQFGLYDLMRRDLHRTKSRGGARGSGGWCLACPDPDLVSIRIANSKFRHVVEC